MKDHAAIVIQDFPPPHIHDDNSLYRNDAKSFIEACQRYGLPSASCCDLPENIDAETRQILIDGGVTPLQGFDSGLDALSNACRYGVERRRMLTSIQSESFEIISTPDVSLKSQIIDEWQGKQRLKIHGVDVPCGFLVNAENIEDYSSKFRYPVVIKAVSAQLPHKSDVGAVRTGICNFDEMKQTVSNIKDSLLTARPELEIRDFLVESMVSDVLAELLVGIKTDRQFGQLLVIASGGVLVELLDDSITLLLPTSDDRIRDALRKLKCFKLLQGFRGKPEADLDGVVNSIRSLAAFAQKNHERLLEMDVNPLLVTAHRCVAADVMIRETAEN